ncbi:MAG: hypothetical protein ABSG94_10080 [Brevinematales bacterium]|jgi:hypothetical protein
MKILFRTALSAAASFFLLLLVSSCTTSRLTDGEKGLLFTIGNFTNNTIYRFDDTRRCETFSKSVLPGIFNKADLTYTFNSSKATNYKQYLYINSILQTYRSEAEAKRNISSFKTAFTVSFKIAGKYLDLKTDNTIFTLGDENYHSYILIKGSTSGNLLITRIGKNMLVVIIMGIYFDDRESLEQAVAETVNNIKKSSS